LPEISVVIPSYNHAAYIAEAVNSVLFQTLSDLELIVVDDGSTDASLDVLAKFSDPRFRIITQSNQGAHAAINRGLHAASGEYLAILNSDDAYHPQRLEKTVGALKANSQLGLVGSYIQIVDSQGKALGIKHGYQDCPPWSLEFAERSFRAGDNLRATLLTENYLATTSNFVFSRAWHERVGEFRPLRYTHDWDFALRLTRIAQLKLLAEPLVRYRIHAANTIRENRAAMVFEIC
jgi:glycosyltransferase involved in cell wall biosynthesis